MRKGALEEASFTYGEASITISFYKNNKVGVLATTTKHHEFPYREYYCEVPFTDLITMINMRLPSLKTANCLPVLVKGDLYVNIRTNVHPYINFANCIILRLGDEAFDLLQYLNEKFLERYKDRSHITYYYRATQ